MREDSERFFNLVETLDKLIFTKEHNLMKSLNNNFSRIEVKETLATDAHTDPNKLNGSYDTDTNNLSNKNVVDIETEGNLLVDVQNSVNNQEWSSLKKGDKLFNSISTLLPKLETSIHSAYFEADINKGSILSLLSNFLSSSTENIIIKDVETVLFPFLIYQIERQWNCNTSLSLDDIDIPINLQINKQSINFQAVGKQSFGDMKDEENIHWQKIITDLKIGLIPEIQKGDSLNQDISSRNITFSELDYDLIKKSVEDEIKKMGDIETLYDEFIDEISSRDIIDLIAGDDTKYQIMVNSIKEQIDQIREKMKQDDVELRARYVELKDLQKKLEHETSVYKENNSSITKSYAPAELSSNISRFQKMKSELEKDLKKIKENKGIIEKWSKIVEANKEEAIQEINSSFRNKIETKVKELAQLENDSSNVKIVSSGNYAKFHLVWVPISYINFVTKNKEKEISGKAFYSAVADKIAVIVSSN